MSNSLFNRDIFIIRSIAPLTLFDKYCGPVQSVSEPVLIRRRLITEGMFTRSWSLIIEPIVYTPATLFELTLRSRCSNSIRLRHPIVWQQAINALQKTADPAVEA